MQPTFAGTRKSKEATQRTVSENYSIRRANYPTTMTIRPRPALILLASAAFWSLWLFWNILAFDAFRSDVAAYWRNSLDWQEPYDVFHLPLYPWLIALASRVTFNLLPPILLMQIVVFAAYLVSALLVYGLLRQGDLDERQVVLQSAVVSTSVRGLLWVADACTATLQQKQPPQGTHISLLPFPPRVVLQHLERLRME